MLCRAAAEEGHNGQPLQSTRGLDMLADAAALAEAADAQASAVCKPVAELHENKMHLCYLASPPPRNFR